MWVVWVLSPDFRSWGAHGSAGSPVDTGVSGVFGGASRVPTLAGPERRGWDGQAGVSAVIRGGGLTLVAL